MRENRSQVSVITIFYARQKLHTIPYDVDRLNAKYQVRLKCSSFSTKLSKKKFHANVHAGCIVNVPPLIVSETIRSLIIIAQVREVLKFSMAILPSVAMSSVIHTLSLTPTLLWIYGAWTYQKNCLFYFSVRDLFIYQ